MRFLRVFSPMPVAKSMASTPVPARRPLSVASSVSRSSAATDDANDLQGTRLVGLFVIIFVVLGAILIPEITKPNSP
jgi:hypothetical protein